MSDSRKTRDQLLADLREVRAELAAARAAKREKPAAPPQTPADPHYGQLLESARAIVVEIDEQGRLTYVSPSIEEVLGYRPEELLESEGQGWIAPEDRETLTELFRAFLRDGSSADAVVQVPRKDGRSMSLQTSVHRYRDRDGGVRTVAMARDVTDVTLAREALAQSEARYRELAENASDVITEVDAAGRVTFVSPNCEQLVGYTAAEIMERGDFFNNRIHPDDVNRVEAEWNVDRPVGEIHRVTYRFRHSSDRWVWVEHTSRQYRTEAGEIRTVIIGRDVTEQMEAQRALEESEARYHVLTEATGDLITESDAESRLLYVSPSCKQIMGYEPSDLSGTTPFLLVHPDDVERRMDEDFEAGARGEPLVTQPYRVLHRDGTWHWMETTRTSYRRADGELIILRVTRDVTRRVESEAERRQLEQRMQQAQKLEGLGVMAGGIAHDFNNLLTPILGDTSLSLLELPPESPVRARLQRVQKAVHRAAALTNQMLAYAGEASLHVELVNLSRLVEEIGELLQTAASRETVLSFDLARSLPMIEADPARISQVVMNLITNASEAVGEAGGTITLETGQVRMERSELQRLFLGADLAEGDYVFVEVSDTGPGMDAETRGRIFDPFFTTKFTGRGLGLAAVLGIVRAHKGAIELDSELGEGTRFRVLFPATRQAFVKRPVETGGVEGWRAEGTVLVVDDEEGVRQVAQDILERAGLKVLKAASASEGVRLFRSHADEIVAVLLDRTMPSRGSEQAVAEMREIRPDARIVLISGYSEEQASERFVTRELDGFLQKPFLPTALLEKVREVIGH